MKFTFKNGNSVDIIPFESIDDVAKKLIPFLQKRRVALSGGSTYDKLFESWAKMDFSIDNSWFIAVDERAVDMDDSNSNWGNACTKFFTPKNIPNQCENFYKSKEMLDSLLQTKFGNEEIIFDSLFLGVGDDGHTASLFPGTPFVEDMSDTTFETISPKGVKKRVTLGAKVIIDAKEVITVLTGKGKENTIEWLKNEDLSKPFISVLSKRNNSTLFVDTYLYSKLV